MRREEEEEADRAEPNFVVLRNRGIQQSRGAGWRAGTNKSPTKQTTDARALRRINRSGILSPTAEKRTERGGKKRNKCGELPASDHLSNFPTNLVASFSRKSSRVSLGRSTVVGGLSALGAFECRPYEANS